MFQQEDIDFDVEPDAEPMSDQDTEEAGAQVDDGEEDEVMSAPLLLTSTDPDSTNRPPSPPLSPSQLVPTPPPNRPPPHILAQSRRTYTQEPDQEPPE
eukprot:6143649-Amphidinium_carterae.1